MYIPSHVLEEKVPYKHTAHQQLWIYMSNPNIVADYINCKDIIRWNNNEIISHFKQYILTEFMGYKFEHTTQGDGYKKNIYPMMGCFPCDAAVRCGKPFNYGPTAMWRCELCPLDDMKHCIDETSTYERVTDLLVDLCFMKDITKFKTVLFEFCVECQKMAFKPVNPKNKEYYIFE